MDFPEFKYIDYAIGGVNRRNNVVERNDIIGYEGKEDCYRTVFRFTKDYKNHCEKTGSVGGYLGECYCDWLPIDIDDEDLEVAYKKTKDVMSILEFDFEVNVKYLFFSGAKGFHILLPSRMFDFKPSKNLPTVMKNIANEIFGKLHDSAIYDVNRLFRLNNSINSKSGKYKISISIQEFNDGIEKILELAEKPQEVKSPGLYDCSLSIQLNELYKKWMTENGKPKSKTKTDWDKIRDGVGAGERNKYACSLAGICMSGGFSKNTAFNVMSGWNNGCDPPLEDAELRSIIDNLYKKEDKNDLQNKVFPIWSVYDEYQEFVKNEKKVNIGIPKIDECIRGIRPGQVLTIMGYTGNFKSALLQWILRHYTKYSGEPVLMFELEMTRLDLFERAVQMESGLTGEQVENSFKQGGVDDLIGSVKTRIPNYYVTDIPYLSFTEIERLTIYAEQQIYNKKTGLIGIDFIQLMDGAGRTNVERVDKTAKEMKSFAKKLNVPLIMLSQVTGIESNNSPISLDDSRDSKTIAQMSDYVIGIWIDENDEQVMRLLKNRKGRLGQVSYNINRDALTFGEVSA